MVKGIPLNNNSSNNGPATISASLPFIPNIERRFSVNTANPGLIPLSAGASSVALVIGAASGNSGITSGSPTSASPSTFGSPTSEMGGAGVLAMAAWAAILSASTFRTESTSSDIQPLTSALSMGPTGILASLSVALRTVCGVILLPPTIDGSISYIFAGVAGSFFSVSIAPIFSGVTVPAALMAPISALRSASSCFIAAICSSPSAFSDIATPIFSATLFSKASKAAGFIRVKSRASAFAL